MRRMAVLILVVLLGHLVVGVGNWSTAAQEVKKVEDCKPGIAPPELGLGKEDSYYWEGVCRPIAPDQPAPASPGGEFIMQPYTVYFAEGFAAVPDSRSGAFRSEFMVVIVRDGTFALDVKRDSPGRVVVSGAGNDIPLRGAFDNREPFYGERKGEILTDREGNPCIRDCEVPPDTVVQLGPGDRIVAEEGAICVYCLLGANNLREGQTGRLEVFVLRRAGEDPSTFSWIASWDRAQKGELPLAQRDERPVVLGWAYFDPGTRCRDG